MFSLIPHVPSLLTTKQAGSYWDSRWEREGFLRSSQIYNWREKQLFEKRFFHNFVLCHIFSILVYNVKINSRIFYQLSPYCQGQWTVLSLRVNLCGFFVPKLKILFQIRFLASQVLIEQNFFHFLFFSKYSLVLKL